MHQLRDVSVLGPNTCKRISAKHSIKDSFAFLWEYAIFRHSPNKKNPWPIVLKFHTVNYAGRIIKPAKNSYNLLARGGSQIGEYEQNIIKLTV
jgi:hypothetical protein